MAGGAKILRCVRMVMEEKIDFMLIKLEFWNAFNEVYRTRVVKH